MTDQLRKTAQDAIDSLAGYRRELAYYVGHGATQECDAEKALRAALAETPEAVCSCPSGDGSLRWPCKVHPPEAETPEVVTRIQELEQLVKAQQKAFDIESNRITFAEHKSLHKMLIRDAIKKMNDCIGRPYSAWDMWLIDAKCMLERVLREWPAPQEVTLAPQSYTPRSHTPSVDALIAEIDGLEPEYMQVHDVEGCGANNSSRSVKVYTVDDVNAIFDKYRARGGA